MPPEEDATLGLVHDRAFWVSDIRGAPGASIDVESFGTAHARIDAAASVRQVSEVDEGGRSGGDTTAELLRTTPVFGPIVPRADRLQVVARGIDSCTIDVRRTGLTLRAALDIDTDRHQVVASVGVQF